MYHFVTGFTSKLAGTERGIQEPQPTFSTLFGEPFMPLDPSVYAKMLGDKIEKYGTKVYLVNTGWSGGPYGVGSRMKLSYTRAMITAGAGRGDGGAYAGACAARLIFRLLARRRTADSSLTTTSTV